MMWATTPCRHWTLRPQNNGPTFPPSTTNPWLVSAWLVVRKCILLFSLAQHSSYRGIHGSCGGQRVFHALLQTTPQSAILQLFNHLHEEIKGRRGVIGKWCWGWHRCWMGTLTMIEMMSCCAICQVSMTQSNGAYNNVSLDCMSTCYSTSWMH